MTLRIRRHRLLTELPSDIIDRDERVRALVRIGANRHHIPASLTCLSGGAQGPDGGHAFIEVVARLLSSHPGRSNALGERRIRDKPRPEPGSEETNQLAELASHV